jgi:hypothetical protein
MVVVVVVEAVKPEAAFVATLQRSGSHNGRTRKRRGVEWADIILQP